MINDLITSIKANLYERVTSPLLGTFAVAWVLWNWRFMVVIFSGMTVYQKFSYVETWIFPSTESFLLFGILYPLLSALALIFIYPYPANFVYKFHRNQQKKLKEIRQQLEDETPLTIEEARKIRHETFQLTKEFDEELKRRDAEIEMLKATNKSLEETIQSYKESDATIYSPDVLSSDEDSDNPNVNKAETKPEEIVSDVQLKLMEYIGNSEDHTDWDRIFNIGKNFGLNRLETEYNMEILLNLKLVKFLNSTFSLSHKGKGYVLNHSNE